MSLPMFTEKIQSKYWNECIDFHDALRAYLKIGRDLKGADFERYYQQFEELTEDDAKAIFAENQHMYFRNYGTYSKKIEKVFNAIVSGEWEEMKAKIIAKAVARRLLQAK